MKKYFALVFGKKVPRASLALALSALIAQGNAAGSETSFSSPEDFVRRVAAIAVSSSMADINWVGNILGLSFIQEPKQVSPGGSLTFLSPESFPPLFDPYPRSFQYQIVKRTHEPDPWTGIKFRINSDVMCLTRDVVEKVLGLGKWHPPPLSAPSGIPGTKREANYYGFIYDFPREGRVARLVLAFEWKRCVQSISIDEISRGK